MKKLLLIYLICFSIQWSFAQRTGNIVEYFGKEKVEKIYEGKVVHIFKKGLALKVQNLGFNSSSFPKDVVFSKFLKDPYYIPQKDKTFDVDFLGTEMKWSPISVNKTNTFSSPSLRSSYVYLSYNSKSEKTVLFEASGHSLVLINGLPHEGDHYDFGYHLIPLRLKKGNNTFILKVGRFPRIRARLIAPSQAIQFTKRDLTLPDVLSSENKTYWAGIRVINATNKWINKHQIKADMLGSVESTDLMDIPPMSVQKVPIKFSVESKSLNRNGVNLNLQLINKSGTLVATEQLTLDIKSKHKHHKKTFISDIDHSVQYYSVAPAKNTTLNSPALFLSVHGASVEAVNQANAYKQKEWGHLVAPTNRRPFGFAWEDWGRLDALEVLKDAKRIYKPDPKRIYLMGHSMGGHGTWYLGATYPDQFAAIAPAAGYPDLLLYRDGFSKRLFNSTDEELKRFGISRKMVDKMKNPPLPTGIENLIKKAGNPSRTLGLIRNYLHHGVYILHGEKDNVVPTEIARDMRRRLGQFHNDFTYYEYPDGTHWYGDHSVDWPPIFDFFKQRTIPEPEDIKSLEFSTASPGVSAKSHFITIYQQERQFELSSFKFDKSDEYTISTKNVSVLEVDLTKLTDTITSIKLDGKKLDGLVKSALVFKKVNDNWTISARPSLSEKGPHRNGGFKDAFKNNMVLVYATGGSKAENDWYYNRARFDGETFWYRANGHLEIIPDSDFTLKKYTDRNVIIYGNKDNNKAWKLLLKQSPIQVGENKVMVGEKVLIGNGWGTYFIVPRLDSKSASIGVISATGMPGMKAAYMNHYLVNGTTFPDVVLFDHTVLIEGSSAVKFAGFFGNDWTIENGEFEWK